MKKKLIIFLLFLFGALTVMAQDSISSASLQQVKDTVPPDSTVQKDSISTKFYPSFILQKFDNPQAFSEYLLKQNIFFADADTPEIRLMQPVQKKEAGFDDKTILFYLILGVCFFLAVIKFGFRKYFKDLFRAFFSPTLSQRQLKEQLHQMPFPALMLNIFFAVSGGVYIYLVLSRNGYLSFNRPLILPAVFIGLLLGIYGIKYLILRICGWLFGVRGLMDNYIFTLFLINKILGVILLPIIVIMAFSLAFWSNIALGISYIFILLLFIYRYIRTFSMIKSSTPINKFHFFLYLCALEVAPILVIGKLTITWLNGA